MTSAPVTPVEIDSSWTPHVPVRVVIADAYAPTRDVIGQLLTGDHRFQVVGSVGTMDEALQLIRETDPDVLLVDPWLSGRAGLPACLAAKQFRPHLVLIALLPEDREDYRQAARDMGADGTLQKRLIARGLVRTLQEVLRARSA